AGHAGPGGCKNGTPVVKSASHRLPTGLAERRSNAMHRFLAGLMTAALLLPAGLAATDQMPEQPVQAPPPPGPVQLPPPRQRLQVLVQKFAEDVAPAAPKSDEELLKLAGVPGDGPGLLQFFRKRVPTEDVRRQLPPLLDRFGDDRFAVREQASAAVRRLGPAA